MSFAKVEFITRTSGKVIAAGDPRYFRPTEVVTHLGTPGKAKLMLEIGRASCWETVYLTVVAV